VRHLGIPLDQVIFSYSFSEILMITRSSAQVSWVTFIPFYLILIILFGFQYVGRRMKPGKPVLILLAALLVCSPVYALWLIPGQRSFFRDMETNAYLGMPPMDTMSETLTSMSFMPTWKGVCHSRLKWSFSTIMSVVTRRCLSSVHSKTIDSGS